MYAAPSSDGLPEKGSSWLPDEALWVAGRESRPQYQTQDLSQLPSFLSLFWIWIHYNIASVLYWFSGHKAYGILAAWPGIELAPLVLEGKVLSTGPLGKSLHSCLVLPRMSSADSMIYDYSTSLANILNHLPAPSLAYSKTRTLVKYKYLPSLCLFPTS